MKGVNIESLESGRPEMRATLDRAEQFLSLVGLLSAMLAAVAVAMAARRFMLRHLDACAMLRCLGLTQNQVTRMYLIEFLMVGLAGSAMGVLVGFGAHFALLAWLGSLVTSRLAGAGPAAGCAGYGDRHAAAARLCAAADAAAAQRAAQPRDPARAGRRRKPMTLATYGLGLASFVALLLWQAGDRQTGADGSGISSAASHCSRWSAGWR
jgi:putative ABC transport system permease protein